MKSKKFWALLIVIAVVTFILFQSGVTLVHNQMNHPQIQTVQARNVSQDIAATGSIHSENEATLHFQTGGKLTYLPLKEGDSVYSGQTIAQLDTYTLQQQLTQALNNYRSTRDNFDQSQQNSGDNVAQNQQQSNFPGVTIDKNNAVSDAIKRIADQNQATLDNSVINVELANYAIQLSTLTSPLNGTLIHEDVTVPNINITTTTAFSVADLQNLVFRANVSASDIDFVSVGSKVSIQIDGTQKKLSGTVERIYPQKTTLPSGQDVYSVDITSDQLSSGIAFGQTGSVLIKSNNQTTAEMIPAWTILGHNTVWVLSGKNVVAKKVKIGQTHGDMMEVTGGLVSGDKIILNPSLVALEKYQLL